MILVDQNNKPIGTQKNDPPKKEDVDHEVLRILRIVEQARRIDPAELCATLEQLNKNGWRLMIDPEIPESQAQVTMLRHSRRSADNKLQHRGGRGWIGLGTGFADAMELLTRQMENQAMAETSKDKKAE